MMKLGAVPDEMLVICGSHAASSVRQLALVTQFLQCFQLFRKTHNRLLTYLDYNMVT